MRGTTIGQVVRLTPLAGRHVHGTIIAIDSQNLRCVATADGYIYAAPDEMNASEHPDCTKPVEAVEPGDVVVLFNGARRRVAARRYMPMLPTGRYRLTFEEDGSLGSLREQVSPAGARYYVLPVGERE